MLKDEFVYKVLKLKELDSDEVSFLELAESYLVGSGYRVFTPISVGLEFKLTKYSDLVMLFYHLYYLLYAEELPPPQNKAADFKIAAAFVKSRQAIAGSKISKKRALEECALIIKTVLLNKDSFHFNQPLRFWMFGTDTCKWITDKALDIIRIEKHLLSEAKLEEESNLFSRSLPDKELHINLDVQLEKVRSRENSHG